MHVSIRLAVALTVNCGYARTAIRELSLQKKVPPQLHKSTRVDEFRALFDVSYQKDCLHTLIRNTKQHLTGTATTSVHALQRNGTLQPNVRSTLILSQYLNGKRCLCPLKACKLLGTVQHATMRFQLSKLLFQGSPCMSLTLL